MANARTLGIPTPLALSRGYGLRVIDYTEVELSGVADAAGLAAMQTDYLQQNQIMRIERIVVLGDSAGTCEIGVYEGDNPIAQRGRDWTPFPPDTIAVSEYPSFLTINPTQCLSIVITGASEGDLFLAVAQYQLVQKVLGQGNWPSS